MTMKCTPILYSFRRCPYAMRARLAIASANAHCSLREIVLRDKPQHMLEISPKGTVPVLQLADGKVIDESLDIGIWALEHNDPEQLLAPPNSDRSEMLVLISQTDEQFKPLLDRYKYSFHSDPAAATASRDEAVIFLNRLNAQLSPVGYLYGEQISLADICILPFVRQFAHVDKTWFWAQDFDRVINWLDAFLASDRFAAIMPKFKVWQPGDETTTFPPFANSN